MPKPNLSEQLDRAIQALLTPGPAARRSDGTAGAAPIAALQRVAEQLRGLPRVDFKAALQAKLEGRTPMASKTVSAPQARQTVTAYLIVKDAARALEFYKQAFGATEIMRLHGPGENIGHAEIRMGNSTIMLSDEFPDYGAVSAATLGGSPVKIHLSVDDVDAVAARAVAAGAKVLHPVQDQFYGERSGQFSDPFGYTWMISTQTEQLTAEEIERRFAALHQPSPSDSAEEPKWALPVPYIRKGFRTLTPYLLVPGAANLIDFYREAFGAEEIFRVARPGSHLVMHAEVRIAGSMLELADATAEFKPRASSNILYVPDVDAVFQRAVQAGATSLAAPAARPWGDRDGAVKDPGGNTWYITTHAGGKHIAANTPSIVPVFLVQNAAKYIEFLKQAFEARELFMAKSPEGEIRHVSLRVGDSILAGGEVHGEFQAAAFLLHMYVPNTDEVYANALRHGATTIRGLEDAPYGDRTASVQDPFGNLWSLATHIKDVKF
ncbi:MAG TPA: VOC family protein [Candidatus Acidoferrales bacterium]|nr:VOC family protein [Candidatus Acidoferrales bacterium]